MPARSWRGDVTDPADQPDADDVLAATTALAGALESRELSAEELKAKAGLLSWNCAKTLAHICDAVLWYAGNLASRSTEDADTPMTSPRAKPPQMVNRLRTSGALLAAAVRDAPRDARGYHSWGRADRSGFAAMGCDEILLHGWDLAQGLGLDFIPPTTAVEHTVRRLFPWAPTDEGHDSWDVLLWANGRAALGDRPPEKHWLWHCDPLDEWNGEIRRWKPRGKPAET